MVIIAGRSTQLSSQRHKFIYHQIQMAEGRLSPDIPGTRGYLSDTCATQVLNLGISSHISQKNDNHPIIDNHYELNRWGITNIITVVWRSPSFQVPVSTHFSLSANEFTSTWAACTERNHILCIRTLCCLTKVHLCDMMVQQVLSQMVCEHSSHWNQWHGLPVQAHITWGSTS